MPDTNRKLRTLWKNVQQGWAELQEALQAQRTMGSRGDPASMDEAKKRVQRAIKAHTDAINAYTELFNSRIHPAKERRTAGR